MVVSSKSDWLIPAGLIALAFIPVAAGTARLVMLAGGAAVTPENARFIAAPIPVVLHIISVTIYCVVGAFQFAPGMRRRHPRWHRIAGRVLVPTGLLAALSGLWMAMTYAIVPPDNALLHAFRLLAGSGMAVSLMIGFVAIRRRDVEAPPGLDAPRLRHRSGRWHPGDHPAPRDPALRSAGRHDQGADDGRGLGASISAWPSG